MEFDLNIVIEILRALSAMDLQNLLGFGLPPLIDLINTRILSAKTKYVITIAICLLVGIVLNYNLIVSESADPARLLANLSTVFITAQTTYALYWEKSKNRAKLKNALEGDTHGKE